MTADLILTSLSLALAAWALAKVRASVRKAERMTEAYWELRYEIGQLKVRANRLEAAAGLRDPEVPPVGAAGPREPQSSSFVPLSSLKK